MRVLIVEDGFQRGTLAAARALAQNGWTVGVGSPHRGHTASSRYCAHWHRVPPPVDGIEAFVAAVRDAVKKDRYELVFAGGDAELLALSARRTDLGAILPHSPDAAIRLALDKLSLTELAREAGLEVPTTSVESIPGGSVIVKERLHGIEGGDGLSVMRTDAIVASDLDAAAGAVARIRAEGSEALVQERVEGRLMALTTLSDQEGRLLCAVQQVADLTYPEEAGVSVRAHTVPLDRELLRRVADLLERLSWFGVAEVQFVVPRDGGAPKLIDLNGRFYGSSALAQAAGADMASAWAGLATGRPFSLPAVTKVGVRYHWLEGDLRRAVGRRSRKRQEVLGSLRYSIGATHSIWSLSDPSPALRFLTLLLRRGARKLLT